MSQQIGVQPPDHARSQFSDLEQVAGLGIPKLAQPQSSHSAEAPSRERRHPHSACSYASSEVAALLLASL